MKDSINSKHSLTDISNKLINLIKPKELLIPNLKTALFDHYNTPRSGVHVSDLTWCPRQQVFRSLKPEPVGTRELNYFIVGLSCHQALQLLAARYPERYEIEKEVHFKQLSAHIDLYDKIDNICFEMKTYRGYKIEDIPKEYQIFQLKCYMSMTGASQGAIIYLFLNNFEDPLFMEFPYTMDKVQRAEFLIKLEADAELYSQALSLEDPSIARHIYYDPANENHWKCEGTTKGGKFYKKCKYWDECKLMRDQERKGMFD